MTQSQQALLVIDVQNEYFTGRLPVTFPEGSLGNILKAMDHAARADIPVAIIQHTAPSKDSLTFRKGSEEWKLHPEVVKRKRNILIEKNLPGSFTGTELEKWLREQGIERVAICGYMTQMCCDTTARRHSIWASRWTFSQMRQERCHCRTARGLSRPLTCIGRCW
jgi:nicotinamidase-related amidase